VVRITNMLDKHERAKGGLKHRKPVVHVIVPPKLENWVATLIDEDDGQIFERRRLKKEREGFRGPEKVRVTFPAIPAKRSFTLQIDNGATPPGLANDRFPGEDYIEYEISHYEGDEWTYDFTDNDYAPKVIE
jgi:hypothetical protein